MIDRRIFTKTFEIQAIKFQVGVFCAEWYPGRFNQPRLNWLCVTAKVQSAYFFRKFALNQAWFEICLPLYKK